MAELNQHQVERRFDKAIANPVVVNIPALPGLFFRTLTLGERGQSSRAYSKALIDYQAQGLPSEHFLSQLLRRAVEASGMSMAVLKRKGALLEKQFKALPEDLVGPFDQLTPAEVAELPLEAQQEREAAIAARGKKMVELLAGIYTDEERDAFQQIQQIEQLEQHLRQQTAEFAARRDQIVFELLTASVSTDGKPYFDGIDALAAIEDGTALVNLMVAWKQFRDGQPSDFFSRS